MAHVLALCITSALALLCRAQTNNGGSVTTPFLPSSWPLAVKGPYLNSWEPGEPGGTSLPLSSPAFWPAWDDQTFWTCMVVVDDVPYRIMGAEPLSFPTNITARQTAISFTATSTKFEFTAGPVNVNATFLSPITPNDLMRQSIPFAYFYLDIDSADGNMHDIRIYSDITPQWLHGNEVLLPDPSPKVNANASLIDSSDFVGLQMQLQDPQAFTEVANHAQDVIGVFAMKSNPNVKYQVGTDATMRALGTNSTGLQNAIDANYSTHALDNPFDAYAISLDLGAIQSTSEPIMWTIGMLRDPSINLTTASGANQLRSTFYWSNFSTIPDVVSFVLNDFDAARSSAEAFDQMIRNVTLSHIVGYTDLLSLVARQIFGTLEITVSKSNDGAWNQSDVMIFSKDMGDVGFFGTSGGTNVVDVLYAGFPAILFLNPDLGQYLLRPLLESQVNDGALIGQTYAPQNLGTQFPNAASNTSSHNLGIEQSGNMLIMVLAHLQRTKDQSMVENYYSLLKSWADYLVNQTLNDGFQTASLSDGITSFNQTNLVLKGIVGISAMSAISSAVNARNDQMSYQAVAQQYMQIWTNGSLSQDHSHLLSSLGDENSSGLIYNMYADKLLGLDLIPSNISSIQSGFYESLLSANRTMSDMSTGIMKDRTPFGIPLDSSNSALSRIDWTMFSIASILNNGGTNAPVVLQPMISMITDYSASHVNNSPLAVIYNPENGMPYSGSNSFAAGSLFAPLVMGNKTAAITIPAQNSSGRKLGVGRLVGGTVGGSLAFLILVLTIWTWRRRSHTVSAYAVARVEEPFLETRGTVEPYTPTTPGIDTPTRLHQPFSAMQREKFAPPSRESIVDSQFVYNTELGFSGSDLSSSSTQRLDVRLADLMREIRMVRNVVQSRPAVRAVRDDGISEAPPSYNNETGRAA